jgi:tricorn protease
VRVRIGSMAKMRRARYLDWVASRRELVQSLATGGGGAGALPRCAVGYVHIADMEEGGYADFTRQFLAECRSEVGALLLDLRGNEGGNISDLILGRLTQRRLGRELAPHGLACTIPEHAAPHGLVVLVDEFTSSDGELLAHHLQAMLHAPVVGHRTWGGVIAMDETELVDGTTVTHPAFVVKLDGASMPLENRGVVPTIPVDATPHDAVSGRDRQLEVAVEQAVAIARRASASAAAASDVDGWAPLPRERKHWSATSP